MNRLSRSAAAVSTFAALAVVLLLAGGRPAMSDDTDLLRFSSGKPYVFFLLDTSASMTLSPGGKWVHANGDDPRSKLYQAKQVLYQVFQDVDDIHFGFAYANQDESRVPAKHWLYYYAGTLPSNWPIPYPRSDPDGPVQFAADGTAVDDVEGDLLTFGPQLNPNPLTNPGITCINIAGITTCTAGSCLAPLNPSTDREKINRFPKSVATADRETQIWLRGAGTKTFLLKVSRPGQRQDSSPNALLGQDNMNIKFELEEYNNCVKGSTNVANLDLKLWTDFLMLDENAGTVDAPNDTHNGGVDKVAGFWEAKDILDQSTCGSGHPFSGQGWEGNYDGDAEIPVPPGVLLPLPGQPDDDFCVGINCVNLKKTTVFSDLGRSLDRGDLLPLDWTTENKTPFLDRLAPNQSDGDSPPDFRIASYFKNQPGAAGVLEPAVAGRVPLYATGPSPMGKMVADFRCMYQGKGNNKCNDEAYGGGGWEEVAKNKDSEWGCRRPYLIVIGDGGDTCKGENPCSDTADLNSQSSVRTWVLAYGANCQSVGNPLSCMAQNGKGELLCPQTASQLRSELLKILGLIREETRAFASAAVPSIQTNVDQRVFLTDFTPINEKSVWDGHFDAYLKPVPSISDTDPRPDRSKKCTGAEGEQGCHLWDAGERLLTQVNGLGSQPDQRRVYYARETDAGPVAPYIDSRRLLLKPTPREGVSDPDKALWEDLMQALNIPFVSGADAAARARAASVIDQTLAVKTATLKDVLGNTKTIQYLLGDIFHSNPLVVGSPPNTKYFSDDLHDYRDFFRKHELRRKMAIVGSNDGMLHVFDAGVFNASAEKFTNGTGKEIFAYIPRTVMPTLTKLAEGPLHKWGVDGTVTIADVFIDPLHGTAPVADDREWRTVLFGGLREGGAGYYALDITQPDILATANGIDNVPQPVNGYIPSCLDGGCTMRFPAALWEFNDTVIDPSGKAIELDEDGNSRPDLGETWSIPNVGRIQLSEGDAIIEKFVLVAGGGFDPESKTSPNSGSGNWLYMIDVETGKTIYKRQLDGAVPSEPAAVDTDQDGFLDRIYIGTTNGKMYRVDLTNDAPGDKFPALADKQLVVNGLNYTVQRVPETNWVPRVLFDANTGLTGVTRPIFYRPSVIFVPSLGLYALAFGTGGRDDLWEKTLVPGRFYVFVDDSDELPPNTILDETRFQQITVTSPAASTQYLLGNPLGNRGWYLVLETDERLITDAFALAGVTFFSTFQPDIILVGDNKNPLCSKTGTSRLFVVSTVNGNPFLEDVSGVLVRNRVVNDFVTNPFTEDRSLNTASSESETPPKETCDEPTMNQLRETLKTLFPVNCRFGNQTIDIKTISSKTALLCIAPVPVCTVEKNWRQRQ